MRNAVPVSVLMRWKRLRWLLRVRRAGVEPLDRILAQTFVVATVLSVASLAVDITSGNAQVMWAKGGVVVGFAIASKLAFLKWRSSAVLIAVIVVVGSLAFGAAGLGPTAAGFFRLWALILLPLIVVLGTVGEVRFTLIAAAAVLVGAEAVALHWGLSVAEQLLNLFVLALGGTVAAATALMVNESKRQTLHDQRASRRINRRLEESRQRQEQTERLALLGQLAASMAHEINNPLAFTMANVRFVGTSLGDPKAPNVEELRAALSESEEGLRRIQGIVARMSAFRGPATPAEDVDLRALLARFLDAPR